MEGDRYIVTRPVRGGYAYFNIADTRSEEHPNFVVVSIYKDTPGAEQITLDLCRHLNGHDY